MNSEFGKLNLRDLLNGMFVAVVTSVFVGLGNAMQNGAFPDMAQLKAIGIIGLSAGLAYLSTNMLSNSNGEILKK